jgi:hypothetical protein
MPFITPSTGNYYVGKGVVSFKKTGALDFRDLGNVESMQITTDGKPLDHFSSREGVKKKDFSVTVEKSGTVKLKCDEWVPENVALALLGDVSLETGGDTVIEIYSQDKIEGELKFVGANDIGHKVNVDLFKVSFKPGATVDLISDGWGELDLTAEMLANDDSRFGTITYPAA